MIGNYKKVIYIRSNYNSIFNIYLFI